MTNPDPENAEKTITTYADAGVFISEIVNYALEKDVLYIFLRNEIEEQRAKQEWVKVPVSKKYPDGYKQEVKLKNTKEPFTIIIDEKESVERFMNYVKSIGV